MITSNNLVHHEFIGLKVHAVNEKNPSLNLKGTVVDETKTLSVFLPYQYHRAKYH